MERKRDLVQVGGAGGHARPVANGGEDGQQDRRQDGDDADDD